MARYLVKLAIALGLSAFGSALQATPQQPADLHYALPAGGAAQRVVMVTRDIAPGQEIPWHTHPGVELAYVESGEGEILISGAEPRRIGPGNSFSVPHGTVHAGRNVGSETLRLFITYVVERDVPLRSPAEAPARK